MTHYDELKDALTEILIGLLNYHIYDTWTEQRIANTIAAIEYDEYDEMDMELMIEELAR